MQYPILIIRFRNIICRLPYRRLSICHSHAKTGSFDHRQIIISVTATDHLFSGQSDTR